MPFENIRFDAAGISAELKPEISEKGLASGSLFLSFCVTVEDQRESLRERRSNFMCVCGTCANWASTKRKILFLVLSVHQVESSLFVCVVRYSIQRLSGLSGPKTATAPSPSFLGRREETPRPKMLSHKKWNKR